MNELQQQVDVEGLYGDVCRIVEQARGGAYRMANVYLTISISSSTAFSRTFWTQ